MKTVKLGSLCNILSGFAFKSDLFGEEGLPIVRIRDVVRGYSDTYYSGDYDEKYILDDGDILIGMDGDFNTAYWNGGRALLNQRVCKIEVDSTKLCKKFIYYFLPLELKKIWDETPFVTVKHLSVKKIVDIDVPDWPLETQKQIAAVLEKADQLRKDCQQMEQELNSLAQSVFIEMFGDPVTNPKGWETTPLDTIAKVQIGPFGSQLHKEDYISNGIPLINPTHIAEGKIVPDKDLTLTLEKFETLPNYHLQPGDIIMGRRGEMGRTALVDDSSKGWFCGTGSLFIRITSELIQPVYLNSVMSSSSIKRWLEEQSLGATMPNLNKGILHSIQVPIPSNVLQTKYNLFLASLKNQQVEQNKQYDEINSFFNALMQKAFSGELDLVNAKT